MKPQQKMLPIGRIARFFGLRRPEPVPKRLEAVLPPYITTAGRQHRRRTIRTEDGAYRCVACGHVCDTYNGIHSHYRRYH